MCIRDRVVDVEQFQLRGAVVDRERLVVRHRPAEGRYRAVVLRPAVPHEVREAVDRHLHAVLLAVLEEQLLPCQLALAVIRFAIAPDERRLDGRGQHDGRFVPVLLERIQPVSYTHLDVYKRQVIAPILQPRKSLEQYRRRLSPPRISDNSTHSTFTSPFLRASPIPGDPQVSKRRPSPARSPRGRAPVSYTHLKVP